MGCVGVFESERESDCRSRLNAEILAVSRGNDGDTCAGRLSRSGDSVSRCGWTKRHAGGRCCGDGVGAWEE